MKYSLAELCMGTGALGMGLRMAGIDAELAWCAEIAPHASKVIAHHWPDVPNLGDLTKITDPPAVDIVAAGFPCQPVSTAGARKGVDDERWLIHDVVRLAGLARAHWLILENVPGLYSANDGEAFGQVVDALAEGGWSAQWAPVRAGDIGAPHRRERWFCVATDTDAIGLERGRQARDGGAGTLGQPQTQPGTVGPDCMALLPTPTANQPGGTAEAHLARKRRGKMNRSDPTVTDLRMKLETLLPTPTAGDSKASGSAGYAKTATHNTGVTLTDATTRGLVDFGQYAPAIARWEHHTRQAPQPLDDGRLSPPFVEWMMGLPAGHVTAVDGLSRAQQLKILGNGVVPQQAAHAITSLTQPNVTTPNAH